MSRFMRFSRVRLKDLENLAGVKDLTNSTSTAVAAAGQQTLLSHDLCGAAFVYKHYKYLEYILVVARPWLNTL